jgi:hypothetical protein
VTDLIFILFAVLIHAERLIVPQVVGAFNLVKLIGKILLWRAVIVGNGLELGKDITLGAVASVAVTADIDGPLVAQVEELYFGAESLLFSVVFHGNLAD